MPSRIVVSPRFELFLALAEVLRIGNEGPLWLQQARRKLDQPARRRMGDLAAPEIWPILAAIPETAVVKGDTDAVIAALADLPPEDFARRCRAAGLDSDIGGLQQAAVDALRRFDRLAFAALWRRAAPDLEAAARTATAPRDAIVFPTLFGPHRFQFGDTLVRIVPVDQLTRAPATASQDPEPIFQALGDRTRYAIASLIAREALTGAELARRLGVSGPTLTHHLKQLREAHLVIEERRGNSIQLRLDRRAIEALSASALDHLFGAGPIALRRSRRS